MAEGSTSQIRALDPTIRERLSSKLQQGIEGLGTDRYAARQHAQTFMGGENSQLPLGIGAADFVPFLGTTMAVEEGVHGLGDAYDAAKRGDPIDAIASTVGAAAGLIPGGYSTVKAAKAALKKIKTMELPKLKSIGSESVPKKQSLKEWAMAGGGVPKSHKDRSDVWHKRVQKYAAGGEVFNTVPDMSDGGEIIQDQSFAKGGAVKSIVKDVLTDLIKPASKTIEAPTIIIPSKLSNVKEAARKREGEYGARRVERASDEIPNLEKMYQEDALRRAFIGGDNARALMTMNPADFEKYAEPLGFKTSIGPKMAEYAKQGDITKDTVPTDEFIKYLQRLQDGFEDIPFLSVNKEESGLPLVPFITGHEGRHRNRALAGLGESTNLIQLLPRAELREPFPRRSQEEYIDAIRKEMEMTGNMVSPEEYFHHILEKNVKRDPIRLPDLYAKGGAVKKATQGVLEKLFDIPRMGINVRTDKKADLPFADLIVDGSKLYESRESDSLRPYVNKSMSIVRTGSGPAKAIGSVMIEEPMLVDAKKFRELQEKHLVPEGSAFDIAPNGQKYLYPLSSPRRYGQEFDVGHGIKARKVIVPDQDMAKGGAAKKMAKDAIEGLVEGFQKIMPPKSKPTIGTQDILPAAEREANLQKFLSENHADLPKTVYHGTGSDVSKFDVNKSSTKNKLGDGIYLAPTTTKANDFAMIRKLKGDASSVMPLHASIKNPYEIHGLDNIPINRIERNKLKELGHDGIFLYDNKNNLQEAVAFEPSQIKSSIGNRGTYDIEDADITKANGGEVHMDKGGAAKKVTKNVLETGVKGIKRLLGAVDEVPAGVEPIIVRTPEERAVIEKFGQKKEQEAIRQKKVEKAAKSEEPQREVKSKGPRAKVEADTYRKMAEEFGDEAVLKAARAGEHLKPTSSGYVGAPRTVTSGQGLGAMRRAMDKDFADSVEAVRLADPERLGTWYDRAKQGIAESTEPYQLPRTLEQHGVYSAGVSPESELGFSLKHLNSRAAGEPEMAYRGAGMRNLDKAVEGDRPANMGFKIGEYANKNDPRLPNEGLFGVNDFRRAQGMGYTDPQGNPWKAGVSETMHPFMDAETALQVDRANTAGTGGRSDWVGPHIQEVPWVYGKAQDLYGRGKKGRYAGDELEGIKSSLQDANNTARDYMYKHAASATHEAIPGASLGHVRQALDMSPEEKLAYSREGRWDMPSPESGMGDFPEVGAGNRDVIYGALGYRQLPSIEAQGFYRNKLGEVEGNPMTIARPLMDFPTGGGGGRIADNSSKVMDTVEQFRAFMDANEAGGYNVPNTLKSVKGKNSMVFDTRGRNPNKLDEPSAGVVPTSEQLAKMDQLLGNYGFGVTGTNRGAVAFPYDPSMDPKVASDAFRKTSQAIEDIYPSSQEKAITSMGYVPGVGKRGPKGPLSTAPYSGEATSDMLRAFAELNPNVSQNLSESEAVRSRIRAKALRDSKKGGTRGDIQETRRFFSEADWPRAVEMIRQGISPAAALAALGYSASSMAGERDD